MERIIALTLDDIELMVVGIAIVGLEIDIPLPFDAEYFGSPGVKEAEAVSIKNNVFLCLRQTCKVYGGSKANVIVGRLASEIIGTIVENGMRVAALLKEHSGHDCRRGIGAAREKEG